MHACDTRVWQHSRHLHGAVLDQLVCVGQELTITHHAVLLHGPRGIGKRYLAETLAAAILCETTDKAVGKPCGQCDSCRWLQADGHPDFIVIEAQQNSAKSEPQKKKAKEIIPVSAVRALSEKIALTAHNHKRVVLIDAVEFLNREAANASLKMLEEPPSQTRFLLLSHQLRQCLPTLISRCHKVAVRKPARNVAASWLRDDMDKNADFLSFFCNAPRALLSIDQEKLQPIFDQWVEQLQQAERADVNRLVQTSENALKKLDISVEWVIDLMQKWVTDSLRRLNGLDSQYFSTDLFTHLSPESGKNARLQLQLFRYYDKLAHWRGYSRHTLNVRLQFETVFLSYIQCFSGQRATRE